MSILIASDIHGSAYYCGLLLDRIRDEQPDSLFLLGDILYHGPQNDLPREYNPKKVIAMLNPLRDSITAVRGNCDAEVDQMVLDFDVMQTFREADADGIDQLTETFVKDLPVKKLTAQRFGLLLEEFRKRVAIRTAVDYTEPLRLALSWAIEEKLIPINPLANVRLPKIPKRHQKILTDSDVEELVAVASGPARRCSEFRIPLVLALYGRLRREECAGLSWEMVDFDRNRITIREAVTMTPDGKEHQKDPKTTLSSRTISMPAFVMAELQTEYLTFLKRPNAHTLANNPAHRVCVRSTDRPYSLKSYSHPVLRLIREINDQREKENRPRMPEASFHDLRHTHAAMLIRRGGQPKVISERLGHASIKITMDLYGYLMPGLQDIVADIFDEEHPVPDASAASAG